MLETMEVIQEITKSLPIGTMTYTVRDTMLDTIEVIGNH